jgi:RNA polymerase sigma-70 factor, ECF subfamily
MLARLARLSAPPPAGLPDEVEDLVQETLLALHLQRGTYDPTLPVSAWVLAIARHKLVDLWRRRGRRDSLHDPLDDVDEQLLAAADDGGARRDLGLLLENCRRRSGRPSC